MKSKPHPRTHYHICSVCGGYAPEFNEAGGKRYCQTHWRALPAEKRTAGSLPPVARDRDGNLVRYPPGSTVEETEEIRQSGWKPTPKARKRAVREVLIP